MKPFEISADPARKRNFTGDLFLFPFMLAFSLYTELGWAAPTGTEGVAVDARQPDGTAHDIRGYGDDFYHRYETADGYTVIRDQPTGIWYYAQPSSDKSDLVPSGFVVGRDDPAAMGLAKHADRSREAIAKTAGDRYARYVIPSNWERRRLEKQITRLYSLKAKSTAEALIKTYNKRYASKGYRAMVTKSGAPRFSRASDPSFAPPPAMTRTKAVGLCILAKFPDQPAPAFTQAQMSNLINQANYADPNGNAGSVRDYFYAQSFGKLTNTAIVTEYVTADHDRSYYADQMDPVTEDGKGDGARELFVECIGKVTGVDLSALTKDGNTAVAVYLLYAGETGYNGLWPHMDVLSSSHALPDGTLVADYMVSSIGATPVIGTICHELGHLVLDCYDYYDYGNGSGDYEKSAGVGDHCLMGSGNHLNGGKTPAPINAYLRYRLGWATALDLPPSGSITVGAADQQFMRCVKPGTPTEYFIIENKSKISRLPWNGAIVDEGLAVWHVDESVATQNELQQMTSAQHYELSLEQADGRCDLEKYGNYGDETDYFDDAVGRNAFSSTTTPDSRWWDGTSSELALNDIGAPGPFMTLSVYASKPTAGIQSITPTAITRGEGSVSFNGSTSRATIPKATLATYRWYSSIDGQLYLGANPSFSRDSTAMSAGQHAIALHVKDSNGLWSDNAAQSTLVVYEPGPDKGRDLSVDELNLDANVVSVNGTARIDALVKNEGCANESGFTLRYRLKNAAGTILDEEARIQNDVWAPGQIKGPGDIALTSSGGYQGAGTVELIIENGLDEDRSDNVKTAGVYIGSPPTHDGYAGASWIYVPNTGYPTEGGYVLKPESEGGGNVGVRIEKDSSSWTGTIRTNELEFFDANRLAVYYSACVVESGVTQYRFSMYVNNASAAWLANKLVTTTEMQPATFAIQRADPDSTTCDTWGMNRARDGLVVGSWPSVETALDAYTYDYQITPPLDVAGHYEFWFINCNAYPIGKTNTYRYRDGLAVRAALNVVEDRAPETAIVSCPTGRLNAAMVAIRFAGSDDVTPVADLSYSYRLVGHQTNWSSFASNTSQSFGGLTNGTYTFEVQAKDNQGQVDPTPAQRTFAVDVQNPPATPNNAFPPHGTILRPTQSVALQASAFADPDPGSSQAAAEFRARTDAGNYAAPVWASGTMNAATSCPISSGTLPGGTTYWWQCRYRDNTSRWSEWSGETSFMLQPNHAPMANAATIQLIHDRASILQLPVFDRDGDEYSCQIVAFPANGTAETNSAASIRYVPAAKFVGMDRFTYLATDGLASSEIKTVAIAVENHAPVANSLPVVVESGKRTALVLSGADADGDALTYAITTNPANGTLYAVDLANGTLEYQSAAGFNDVDDIGYAVSDGLSYAAGTLTLMVSNPAAPMAPAEVSASKGAYSNKVSLTWNESSGATRYEVWRHTNDNSKASVILSGTNLAATAFDDVAVEPGARYFYWVKARSAAGTSWFSASDYGYAYVPNYLSVEPAITNVPAAATSGRGIAVAGNVLWTATRGADSAWITVTAGSPGASNGTVIYSVRANDLITVRTGTVVVAGGGIHRTCTVVQAGATPMLAIDPTSTNVPPYASSGRRFAVVANVPWTASRGALDTWIAVTAGHSGSGNGTVTYDVAVNSLATARTGTIAVAGGGITRTLIVRQNAVAAQVNDFDGDWISDMAVFQPAGGNWSFLYSGGGRATIQFGWSAVVPVPADYDGDDKTDLAVYHPETGNWHVQESGAVRARTVQFGWAATVPLPGDYDGDGRADLAVFHSAAGRWHFLCSTAGRYNVQWGWSTTIPVPADYDGDGKTDVAVYHPPSGLWQILKSSTGGAIQKQWGWSTALPVPADYDGDGKADIAVFHRATGTWRISYSGGGSRTKQFGWASTIPVAADYDGDGAADLAVYHPATGNWHVLKSTTGGIVVKNWGWNSAKPTLLYPLIHSWFGLP